MVREKFSKKIEALAMLFSIPNYSMNQSEAKSTMQRRTRSKTNSLPAPAERFQDRKFVPGSNNQYTGKRVIDPVDFGFDPDNRGHPGFQVVAELFTDDYQDRLLRFEDSVSESESEYNEDSMSESESECSEDDWEEDESSDFEM